MEPSLLNLCSIVDKAEALGTILAVVDRKLVNDYWLDCFYNSFSVALEPDLGDFSAILCHVLINNHRNPSP